MHYLSHYLHNNIILIYNHIIYTIYILIYNHIIYTIYILIYNHITVIRVSLTHTLSVHSRAGAVVQW